jgi:hypothetical protein
MSPDSKPSGNILAAINITPANFSEPRNPPIPKVFSNLPKRALPTANKKLHESGPLHVDADITASSPDDSSRSTPSPPPVLVRLGGIVSGGKNIFIGEKQQQSQQVRPCADHFGRSNMFSK